MGGGASAAGEAASGAAVVRPKGREAPKGLDPPKPNPTGEITPPAMFIEWLYRPDVGVRVLGWGIAGLAPESGLPPSPLTGAPPCRFMVTSKHSRG